MRTIEVDKITLFKTT